MNTVIAIRFSLLFPDRLSTGIQAMGSREAWFEYRSKLFASTMQECLMGNTVLPTKVGLVLAQGDQELFEKHLKPRISPQIGVVFSDGPWVSDFDQWVGRDLAGPTLYFRLDSDDLISDDYIESFVSTAHESLPLLESTDSQQKSLYLVAPFGYISDTRGVQQVVYTASPFLACLTPQPQSIGLAYAFNHHEVAFKPNVWCEKARWMQIVHGKNADNKFRKVDPNFAQIQTNLGLNARGESVGECKEARSSSYVALSASPLVSADLFWPEGFGRLDLTSIG